MTREPLFVEVAGGRVISMVNGNEVLRVDVDSLMVDDARKVIDAILPALEAALGRDSDNDDGDRGSASGRSPKMLHADTPPPAKK